MDTYKATMTLMILILVFFGAYMLFGETFFKPMLADLGTNFRTMINGIFSGTGMDAPGS